MESQIFREQSPAVSIGHLSISQPSSRYPEPWVCLFPRELELLGLSRPLLTLMGELSTVVGKLSDRGVLIFRSGDLTSYAYTHKMCLLNALVKRGVIKKAGLGYWAINPLLLWGGPLKTRVKAIENWIALENRDYRGGW